MSWGSKHCSLADRCYGINLALLLLAKNVASFIGLSTLLFLSLPPSILSSSLYPLFLPVPSLPPSTLPSFLYPPFLLLSSSILPSSLPPSFQLPLFHLPALPPTFFPPSVLYPPSLYSPSVFPPLGMLVATADTNANPMYAQYMSFILSWLESDTSYPLMVVAAGDACSIRTTRRPACSLYLPSFGPICLQ